MGPVEQRIFQQTETTPFSRADWLGRKVLRGGKKLRTNIYQYQGKVYTVIGGRAVECEEAAAIRRERIAQGYD